MGGEIPPLGRALATAGRRDLAGRSRGARPRRRPPRRGFARAARRVHGAARPEPSCPPS